MWVQIPLKAKFSFVQFFEHALMKVKNTELQDINQLMGYKGAY